jgi:hypothetical protein
MARAGQQLPGYVVPRTVGKLRSMLSLMRIPRAIMQGSVMVCLPLPPAALMLPDHDGQEEIRCE